MVLTKLNPTKWSIKKEVLAESQNLNKQEQATSRNTIHLLQPPSFPPKTRVQCVSDSLVRRFSIVACVASLAIMRALARRLQNRLIHLFLIQLLLFPSVVVV